MRLEPDHRPLHDGAPPPPQTDDGEATRLRVALVEQLRAAGAIHDPAVEQALLRVPRHLFLPQSSLTGAYENVAVATRWERGAAVSSVSQPEMVAMMLEQLRIVPGMRVLEIGAGAGYNAALLAELVGPAGSVTTIELDPELASEAAAHLTVAGYSPARARVIAGDGWAGWAEGAPWDRIMVTVGVWDISPAWVEQLAANGVLLAPLWLGVPTLAHPGLHDAQAAALEKIGPHIRFALPCPHEHLQPGSVGQAGQGQVGGLQQVGLASAVGPPDA